APLAASRAEVEQAAAALAGPSRLELADDATEAAVRELAPAPPRVLHLATHALTDERLAEGAALLLTPAGEDDGLLTASEIAALDLPVDLAVLAACRSALGSAHDGRALSSLTGAFLAAGAGGVVASLWEVGDATSAIFMTELYRELGAGVRPVEALARVKRRLRADPRWADPSVWGAFVLIGDPAPVAAARARWLVPALLSAIALAALALFLRYRAGSRRSSSSGEAASSAPPASNASTRTR
ncbi:MAG: CHAT domain-containing protein, partial [Acidobacteria bacterium]|nr:CHAT domain-containing protein [Acidobacteriota bacterium]